MNFGNIDGSETIYDSTYAVFDVSASILNSAFYPAIAGESGGEYGRQRVWGAVGWGLLVVLAGALIDAVSGHSAIKDYTPAFLLTLALFSLDFGTVTRIKLPQAPPASPSKPSMVSCLCWGPAALRLLGQPRVALFVLSCVVVGASTGALWTYQVGDKVHHSLEQKAKLH